MRFDHQAGLDTRRHLVSLLDNKIGARPIFGNRVDQSRHYFTIPLQNDLAHLSHGRPPHLGTLSCDAALCQRHEINVAEVISQAIPIASAQEKRFAPGTSFITSARVGFIFARVIHRGAFRSLSSDLRRIMHRGQAFYELKRFATRFRGFAGNYGKSAGIAGFVWRDGAHNPLA